jgi:cell division septation protein DedD
MRTWLSGSICFLIVAISGIAFAQQSFYAIHISSHRQQAKADTEVQNLKAQGLDAFARYEKVEGKGMWYRIYVGKYASKQEAAYDMNRLRRMKVSKYFAIRKISGEQPATAATGAAAASKARPAAKKPVNYYLFVGFYRDLEPARKEAGRLNAALAAYGYSAFITRETVADGMNYRVYIGTYTGRQQAAASGAELKDKKLLTSFYIPVPTTQDMIAGRMPAAAAGAAAAAAAPGKTAAEKDKAAGRKRDKKPAAKITATAAGADDFSRFALMLKGGAFSPQMADKFVVSAGTTTYRISDDPAPQVGIEAAVWFNKIFGLYAGADTVLIDDIDWTNFFAGPVLNLQAGKAVTPYLKAGAVYGDFSWDAPGEFDSSFGWEVGVGVHFLKSNFKFGIEFAYRDLSFDYLPASGTSVSENPLDMSGYSLLANLSYWF